MYNPFDKIATAYDDLFTNTMVGKAQRSIVWKYLNETLPLNSSLNILELNCGTGEDAIRFAQKGNSVLASDSSETMLKVTEEKITRSNLNHLVSTKKIDLNNPYDLELNSKFDLIFSNFGGLNCIDKITLEKLTESFSKILNANGKLILVLMPKFSLWESVYFLFKFKFGEIFRRSSTKPLNVRLNGGFVDTYYYSPRNIAKIFSYNFKVNSIKPVGLFIPPSFMNGSFKKKKRIFSLLKRLEKYAYNFSFLSYFSDHYIIELELN